MGRVQNNGRSGRVGSGQYSGRTKWARARYDFAVDGGAVGAINLRGDALPEGAIILSTAVRVETVVASGGAATVSLGVESAVDVRTAVVVATAPAINSTGLKVGATTRASAAVAVTEDRHVVATIAVAALTAGKFDVLVEYIELA